MIKGLLICKGAALILTLQMVAKAEICLLSIYVSWSNLHLL